MLCRNSLLASASAGYYSPSDDIFRITLDIKRFLIMESDHINAVNIIFDDVL